MATGRRVSGAPGTGYVSLSDWQGANATGARSLADRLVGNANSAGTAAQRDLDLLQDRFNYDVQGGTLNYNDNGLTSDVATARSQKNYAGPDGLSDVSGYNEAMGAADKASRGAKQVGDLYGRATALQDMAPKGSAYTSGQRLLDSALAGGAGGSRLAQVGAEWGSLFKRAQGMESASAKTAQDARASSADARAQYAAAAPRLLDQENATRARDFRTDLENLDRQREAEEEARPRQVRGPTPPGVTPGRKGREDFFKGW